jgi:hypothetical protein
MQSRTLGHEIPERAGAGVSANGCPTHVCPPSTVASITADGVAEVDGDDGDDVVGPAASGRGVPTAQQ